MSQETIYFYTVEFVAITIYLLNLTYHLSQMEVTHILFQFVHLYQCEFKIKANTTGIFAVVQSVASIHLKPAMKLARPKSDIHQHDFQMLENVPIIFWTKFETKDTNAGNHMVGSRKDFRQNKILGQKICQKMRGQNA